VKKWSETALKQHLARFVGFRLSEVAILLAQDITTFFTSEDYARLARLMEVLTPNAAEGKWPVRS